MALVGVEHLGVGADRGERLQAADAEQDLLAQPVLAVAAVEPVRDRPLGRRVLGHVGVEQVERHAADVDLPDGGVQQRAGQLHADAHRLAGGVDGAAHRQRRGVERVERLALLARRGQVLAEVAVAVEEADRDDRHAQVGGGLEVVAGQHAEAAGVLRQRVACTPNSGDR